MQNIFVRDQGQRPLIPCAPRINQQWLSWNWYSIHHTTSWSRPAIWPSVTRLSNPFLPSIQGLWGTIDEWLYIKEHLREVVKNVNALRFFCFAPPQRVAILVQQCSPPSMSCATVYLCQQSGPVDDYYLRAWKKHSTSLEESNQ